MDPRTRLTRRTALTLAGTGTALAALPSAPASASTGIVKPLPAEYFYDYGTNAEMRWDSVRSDRYPTAADRLFVRNHSSTPLIDARSYRLEVFGDGLRERRGPGHGHSGAKPVRLSLRDLRKLPKRHITTVHECTGNARSFFDTQQGTPAAGTQWKLGSVGAVTWEGVRVADLLEHLGVRRDAVDVMATGLDPAYVDKGTDYGRVRRPFPIAKALDDAFLAWGMNGVDLLPDHGAPLRLVLPGWVGIGSIKWLGSLEVARTTLTSPWNTKWYRMTGGDYPADSPPLTVNPVRSAWELPFGATLPGRAGRTLHGRSWSGAGPIGKVEVSTDSGSTWRPAKLEKPGTAWTRWSTRWPGATSGDHTLLARATDVRGRTQPVTARFNDAGYFFDAVVKHPVRVA